MPRARISLSIYTVIFLLLAFPGSVYAAQIYSWGGKNNADYLSIEGEIVEGDLRQLQIVHERAIAANGSLTIVGFNSPGGDLNEAMSIGRWIRKKKLTTGIAKEDSCASACVYAFAGGIQKAPFGPILIHRPFLTALPAVGADVAMKAALAGSRAYFAEMNVPESLADVMFEVDPASARRMTWKEVRKYHLAGNDIASEEERVLGIAKNLGISRLEYNKRLQAYQRSPELARCMTLQDGAKIQCARRAIQKYGISAP